MMDKRIERTRKYRFVTLMLLALMLISLNGFSQTWLRKGDRLYANCHYAQALQMYHKHLKRNSADQTLTGKIAQCYRLTNNYEESEYWFSIVINHANYDSLALLYYADALRNNGKYEEAKYHYLKYYQETNGVDPNAFFMAQSCDSSMAWINSPVLVEVENEKQYNSPYSEFSPSYFSEGLIFTSDRKSSEKKYSKDEIYPRTMTPYLKLFYSCRDTINALTSTIPLQGEINNPFHLGPGVLKKDNNTLFYTSVGKKKKAGIFNLDPTRWIEKTDRSGELFNGMEIYSAKRKGDRWVDIKPFQHNDHLSHSVFHPAISPDGEEFFFASDKLGGYGGIDLYYCLKTSDTTWGEPINLGPEINTIDDECFPTIDETGTLYFSSNGHLGMGGLDLYSAKREGDRWREINNLKYPFNSPRDDFGIVFNTKEGSGLFSSNRTGGFGGDDIYSFRPKPLVEEIDTLFTVNLEEKKSLQTIPYSFTIFFDFDKDEIRAEAKEKLNLLKELLTEQPELKLIISGYTDSRGTKNYNRGLSERRAYSAGNYLMNKGIKADQLLFEYFGENKLSNECADNIQCSEEQHQLNRRVVLKPINGDFNQKIMGFSSLGKK